MIEERYELALDRIRLMQTEDTVKEPYRDYFKKMAEFVLMLDELRDELLDGRYQKLTLEELRTWNRRRYQDVLPEQYEESYANPDYACKMFGKESGQILGMLYAELRGAVVYVFEGKTEYLAILVAPNVKLNIIRDYEVVEKREVNLPDELCGIVKCANPKCITNNEPMPTLFHASGPISSGL